MSIFYPFYWFRYNSNPKCSMRHHCAFQGFSLSRKSHITNAGVGVCGAKTQITDWGVRGIDILNAVSDFSISFGWQEGEVSCCGSTFSETSRGKYYLGSSVIKVPGRWVRVEFLLVASQSFGLYQLKFCNPGKIQSAFYRVTYLLQCD